MMELSSTTHDHTSAGHDHVLTTGSHSHSVTFGDRTVSNSTSANNGYTVMGYTAGNQYSVLVSNGNHRHNFQILINIMI